MKKNKLLVAALVGCGCFALNPAMAQDQTIKLVTSKAVGEEVTFMVNKQNVPISVDWGNGTPVEVTTEGEGLVDVSGTLQGSTITITAGAALNTLACPGIGLTSIDVSAAPGIHSLFCQNNELTTLDITALTALTDLNVANNRLTSLELTADLYPQLENLNISGNELSGRFNLNNTCLQQVNISDNSFDSFYLTYNANVDGVKCSGNQLTSLNLLRNQNLHFLLCDGNELKSITLPSELAGGMPSLGTIVCNDNQLTTLDLSNCPALESVSCSDNELTSLSLPQVRLYSLDCTGNHLGFTSLPAVAYRPTVLNFSPQDSIDISEGLDTVEGVPFLPLCPSYEDAENEEYQLNLDDQYNALVTFSWYSVDEEGNKTKLSPSTASNVADFRKMQGRFAFFKKFNRVYAELTHMSYPGITLATSQIRVLDPETDGIEGVTTEGGFLVTVQNGALYMTSPATTAVKVFTLDGKMAWSGSVGAAGVTVNLPKGVYVVNGKKVLL